MPDPDLDAIREIDDEDELLDQVPALIAALSAANALIAESADEKAAMQAERDEAPTEQSARVAFKSWPVDTQRRFIRQLQDEHAYCAGVAGHDAETVTNATQRANHAEGDRDRLAAQVETLTVELDGAHRQFAQEREDWHASDDRCAALQEQIATLRAALDAVRSIVDRKTKTRLREDGKTEHEAEEVVWEIRAALSQSEPEGPDPTHVDDCACDERGRDPDCYREPEGGGE